MMALNKEPERRYGSVEELSKDIQRHLAGYPVRARPETIGYRAVKFARRHAIGVAAAGLVVLSLMVGMAGTLWQSRVATRERERAQAEAAAAAQVAAFLTDLFRASDPEEVLGDTITVREVLERGRLRIGETLHDQPEVHATMLSVLGDVYKNLGRYEDARALLEEALTIRRQEYGSQDARVAATLGLLAEVFRKERRFRSAVPLYEEALRIYQLVAANGRNNRDDNLRVAAVLTGLGYVLRDLGEPDSAETLVRESLEIRRRLQGDNHAEFIKTMAVLAYILRVQGEVDSAEVLYRGVLAKLRVLGDAGRAELPATLNNLAYLLRLKKDYAAAEPLYQEALSIHRSIFGEQHPSNRTILGNREVVSLARADKSVDDMRLGRTLTNGLGRFLSEQGRCAEAEAPLREGVELLEREAPDHRWTAEAKRLLGSCVGDVGRFAEAEELLIQSYEALRATGDSERRRAELALERLVRLYEAWGRPEEAVAYRSQLAAMHTTRTR
jgi:serine/threonine-protein kinase